MSKDLDDNQTIDWVGHSIEELPQPFLLAIYKVAENYSTQTADYLYKETRALYDNFNAAIEKNKALKNEHEQAYIRLQFSQESRLKLIEKLSKADTEIEALTLDAHHYKKEIDQLLKQLSAYQQAHNLVKVINA